MHRVIVRRGKVKGRLILCQTACEWGYFAIASRQGPTSLPPGPMADDTVAAALGASAAERRTRAGGIPAHPS